MNFENYRISKSRSEIISCLEKKFKSSGIFKVWQKNEKGDREFIVEAKLFSFNAEEGFFSLSIDPQEFKKSNTKLEYYFLLEGHDFVFKSKLSIDQVPTEYRFQFPKEVRLKELRTHSRKYFSLDDKITVEVKFNKKNAKESEKVFSSCPVLNISKGGVCIIVSKETLTKIDIDKEIEIIGLGFFENLESDMKAIVKNARVYINKSLSHDDQFALGLQFQ